MMIEKLRKLNPELEIYSIRDEQFRKYGNVLNMNTQEIVDACRKLTFPETGSEYIASVDNLENLEMSEDLRQVMFGGCPAQIGITHGYNRLMNGLEYHKCSEINVAATPLCLILGLQYEMDGTEYDSAKVKAFYLEKGDAVEVYATSLHFCPCQVRIQTHCLIIQQKISFYLKRTNGLYVMIKIKNSLNAEFILEFMV